MSNGVKGGQPGNTNAQKGSAWRNAINRALEHRSRAKRVEALDELAEKLLEQCERGDISALRELGDRLDGKPQLPITGELEINLQIVRYADNPNP